MNNNRTALLLLVLGSFFVLNYSCKKKDEPAVSVNPKSDLSGVWEFVLSPDHFVLDTTLVKGMRPSDEGVYYSIMEDIYLYGDGKGNIMGSNGLVLFEGSTTSNMVELKVYERRDGLFDISHDIDDMDHISTMFLTIDEFGGLAGNGTYEGHPDHSYSAENTYFVKAQKLQDINTDFKSNIITKELCHLGSEAASILIGFLTEKIFRPMGSCWLHKDGGGFYVFGHVGPGNSVGVDTQTVYYPWEWSPCHARKYNFKIELKGSQFDSNGDIIERIINDASPSLFSLWGGGMSSELLKQLMDEFEHEFGGYAISIAYDTYTHNASLYVNVTTGSAEDVKQHELIKKLYDTLKEKQVGHLYLKVGKDISDDWHLKRSELGCSSPLVFEYLVGLNKVEYN